MRVRLLALLLAGALCLQQPPVCTGRPSNAQENLEDSYTVKWLRGAYVGCETLLALMGYYDEDSTALETEHFDSHALTTMQVVGMGLGRTGTTSLAMALEMLGYSVVHDDEHADMASLFEQEEEGKITEDDLHVTFGKMGYNVSFKSSPEWVLKHSEVKVILTVRDSADGYVDSWINAAPFVDLMQTRPFLWMTVAQQMLPSLLAEYKGETTGDQPELYLDRATLRTTYEDYVRTTQRTIPNDRLLT